MRYRNIDVTVNLPDDTEQHYTVEDKTLAEAEDWAKGVLDA